MRSASVAIAMALGAVLCTSPQAALCSERKLDFSSALCDAQAADPQAADPQPEVWLAAFDEPAQSTLRIAEQGVAPLALTQDAAPVAPLPPGLVLGSAGIGLVGWATYRIKKHGL